MSEIKYDENNQKYKIFDDDKIRDLSDDEKIVFKQKCYWEYCRNCNDYDDCDRDVLKCDFLRSIMK